MALQRLRIALAGTISGRSLSLGLFAITIAALVVHFVIYLRYAFRAVTYPYEVFDAEGIVWQQVMLIPGPLMYGDINRFPFIVFHYPPVYHLLVRVVAWLGVDPLIAGRGISVLASLVTGLLIAAIAFRMASNQAVRLARVSGAVTAGLTFFCFYPVIAVSPLMRVDMLALALSLLGIWCAIGSLKRGWRLYLAAVMFLLAAFTKQTSIIAPLAVLLVMLPVNFRLTLKAFCFGLVLGGGTLAILSWITDGGFLRHLILYNINRYSFQLLGLQFLAESRHLIFIALAFVSALAAWKQLTGGGSWAGLTSIRSGETSSETVQFALLLLYLVLSTLMLFAVGKSGGGLNYFVEWMAILSILIGLLVAAVVDQIFTISTRDGIKFTSAMSFVLPIVLLIQIFFLPASRDFGPSDQRGLQELAELVEQIRSACKPILSDDMVLLMKAGKKVPFEPAIFLELTSTGRWDERQIIDMITEHDFSFVLTRGYNHFTPAVARAIDAAYPRTAERAGHTVHLPVEPQ